MNRTNPKWLDDAIFYEIYPQSFYDTNADGIGDLQGIIDKLDYIKWMGFNAIWVNPCFLSPFRDAGYDVQDFRQIAPRYGTNDDAKRLFAEAKKRGMRVCLDFVAGHTALEHEWFQQSCKAEPNKYSNWYVWTNNIWDRGDSPAFILGYGNRCGAFLSNFFYAQPALNYGYANPDPAKPWQLGVDHPDVQALRKEMVDTMRFWMDMGCSGFRVDMAASLVKNDVGSKKTIEFWNDVRAMFDADYPECVLISEWGDPKTALQAGFHIDFYLQLREGYCCLTRGHEDWWGFRGKTSPSYFSSAAEGSIQPFIDDYVNDLLVNTKGLGVVSLFSGNHDVSRQGYGRTQQELKLTFVWLLTMPGVPFVYYGDEIGMDHLGWLQSHEGGYQRTGARTPMQWDNTLNAGFSKATAEKLYLPIDPKEDRPTVADQIGTPDSLLECVRALNELRKATPALQTYAELSVIASENGGYPFVYERKTDDQRILVVINPSAEAKSISVDYPADHAEKLLGDGVEITSSANNTTIKCCGISWGIFQL